MVFLGEPAIGGLDRAEIGVALELERVECPHLVTGAAAVARPRPLPVLGLAEGRGFGAFIGFASGGGFGVEPFEIIPVAVVLGSVGLAEIPALAAVGRFWRGPIAGRAATVAVAGPNAR